ncbi:MAG: DNA repair protein RadA [Bacteroidetes bacterium]|nr:DNA repair protein RadA [Bacteroidota bacterium]
MARLTTQFICQSCGSVSPKWMGKCSDCGEWNTLIEEVVETGKKKVDSIHQNRISATPAQKPSTLAEIPRKEGERMQTAFAEFNRVMGGGIMKGSLILLGGDPGIGKSTLMMQVAGFLESGKETILYVSAEESVHQVRGRAERLGLEKAPVLLLAETNLNEILVHARNIRPALLIIDSIQTVYLPDISSAPGSVSQVRECTSAIMTLAKSEHITTFITGHVTKDGSIAGPRVLEHLVDTVLQFEGDRNHHFRILRSLKNRFGSTNEIGVFDMNSRGLKEILNPSEIFLSEFSQGITGSVISVTMEGTRPILLELQALVTNCNYGFPQRNTNGFDQRRMTMLLAVLEKRLGVPMGTQDVFLNVASGLKIDDPAADLGVCTAILASFREWSVARDVVFIGEIGLGGEIRSVSAIDQRLSECAKLGFKRIVAPKSSLKEADLPAGIEVIAVTHIQDVFRQMEDWLAGISM